MDEGRSTRTTAGHARMQTLDLASLACMLKVCDLDAVLLDRHGPRAMVESGVHAGALICSAVTEFRSRGRFMLPLDWCLLAYVHQTDPHASWCHGVGLENGMVLTVLPDGSSEFVLSAGSRLTMVLIPLGRFKQRLSELGLGAAATPMAQCVRLFTPADPAAAQTLEQLASGLSGLLREASFGGRNGGHDGTDAYVRAHLMAMLSASSADRPRCSRGRLAHYRILQRAEDFMRTHLRRNMYMHEICNAAGVSERALRYAFDDLLGISPNRYLSMLRLCTASRSLAASDAGRRSVKSIAMNCGLWDLSRFADNYRRTFGELPSDTLLRSPAAGF